MKSFESKIGYIFRDKSLLSLALTHTSYANEAKRNKNHNERLEFLGDSVLSIIVSEYLYKNLPNMPEGELSKPRAALVCEKSLHIFAQKIKLGEFIMLGKGEEITGGRERPSILADAFEAVIAAVFLDGGFEPVTKYILGFMPEVISCSECGEKEGIFYFNIIR